MHALRPVKIRHGRIGILIIATMALVLIAVAAVNFQQILISPSTQSNQIASSPLAMQFPPSTSSEPVVPKTVLEPSDIFGEDVASLEEAQNRSNFKVLSPRAAPAGYSLARIGVNIASLPQGQAAIVNLRYSGGGHEFIISQRADGTNMGSVDELLPKWPGFVKVDVNGCASIGHEKSSQTVRGETWPVPASVMWWCDGVIRTVLSYDLSLAEVHAIAKSMQ